MNWKNYQKEKPTRYKDKQYLVASGTDEFIYYTVAYYSKAREFWFYDMDDYSLNEVDFLEVGEVNFWMEIEKPVEEL